MTKAEQTPTADEAWILRRIVTLTKPGLRIEESVPQNDHNSSDDEDGATTAIPHNGNESESFPRHIQSKIDAACILWDLCSSPQNASFCTHHNIILITTKVLRQTDCPRLLEVCCGLLANLSHLPAATQEITDRDQTFQSIATLFATSNEASMLLQLCRLISTCVCWETESARQQWCTEFAKPENQLCFQLCFIIQNTLDQDLLSEAGMLVVRLVCASKACLERLLAEGIIQATEAAFSTDSAQLPSGALCLFQTMSAIDDHHWADHVVDCVCRSVLHESALCSQFAVLSLFNTLEDHPQPISPFCQNTEFLSCLLERLQDGVNLTVDEEQHGISNEDLIDASCELLEHSINRCNFGNKTDFQRLDMVVGGIVRICDELLCTHPETKRSLTDKVEPALPDRLVTLIENLAELFKGLPADQASNLGPKISRLLK